MPEKTPVSIVKCAEYDFDKVLEAVRKAVLLAGGLEHLKKLGRKALLKPNILFGVSPEKAVTTHPVFLDAVITVFKERGFEVTVGESPALDTFQSGAKKSGILDVVHKHGVPFAGFTGETEMSNPDGKIVKRFRVAEEIKNCDFIVSVPKLKTHAQMFYTGAMKNLFGFVPGLQKTRFHFRFPERKDFADMLVDLNLLLKPAFALMDGIVSMSGRGPSGGDPFPLGLVLASRDVLALDIIASEIIGYRHREIPVLKQALERKNSPWVRRAEDIETTGESVPSVRPAKYEKVTIVSDMGFIRGRVPSFVYNLIKNSWIPRPFFSRKKCIRCGRCAEICSASALGFIADESPYHKRIVVDMKKCIRCYCCHEICPAKAVSLGRYVPGF